MLMRKREDLNLNRIKCHSCSIELPPGSLKYIIEVKSFADFDGFIEDCPDDVESGMEELLRKIEDADQKTLEDEVYQNMAFIMCKTCKDKFYKRIFDASSPIGMDIIKDSFH